MPSQVIVVALPSGEELPMTQLKECLFDAFLLEPPVETSMEAFAVVYLTRYNAKLFSRTLTI